MKLQYVIVLALFLFVGCRSVGDKNLVGDWGLIEFRITRDGKESVSSERILRDAGAVWDTKFLKNGKFQQDVNMSNPAMTMKTQKGIWESYGDSVKIELHIDTITTEMHYKYQITDDILTMSLEHPISHNTVISKFRKKQVK